LKQLGQFKWKPEISTTVAIFHRGSFIFPFYISPTGYYQPLGGQSECDQCPAGSSCNSTHSQLCPDNYVSPLGVADCITCPDGNLCMFFIKCI